MLLIAVKSLIFANASLEYVGKNLGQSTNQGNAVPIAPEGRSGLAQSEPFILSVRFSHLKKCMEEEDEEEASVSQSSLPHENNEQGIGRWLYS